MIRARRSACRPGTVLAAAVLLTAGVAGSAAAQEMHLLVVSGLGGEPTYQDEFFSLGERLIDAAAARGVPAPRRVWLSEKPERSMGKSKARSTRENVEAELAGIAAAAGPDDRILVVLIGHGAGAETESKLNLPGPDLSGSELAGWLNAFPTQTVAVVNTASASGGFVGPLAGSRRIVVTATRSPRERNQTRFGGFFVAAFDQGGADADKDDRVSLLEAFSFARREVERAYARDNALLTEHALLEDDGDGEGSPEPAAGPGDGRLAAGFFLGAPGAAIAARVDADPELARLLVRKTELEQQVRELRSRRDSLPAAEYEARLESRLLELARLNRELRERDEGSR